MSEQQTRPSQSTRTPSSTVAGRILRRAARRRRPGRGASLTLVFAMLLGSVPPPAPAEPTPPRAREIRSLRARDTKTFLNPDGTFRARIGHRQHYRAASGRLEEVDLSFRDTGNGHVADRNDVVVRVREKTLEVREARTGAGIRWLLPAAALVSGRRAQFSDGGLDWTYETTRAGVKLSAEVGAARGERTYRFSYRLLRGADPLSVDAEGNLSSDAFVIPRAFAIGANGRLYRASRWRLLEESRVGFDFDDTGFPSSAFPYVLDPTTSFRLAALGDDGYLTRTGGDYPPAGGIWASGGGYVSRSRRGGSYEVATALMRFDTADLPDDATVQGADLTLQVFNGAGNDSFTMDWYDDWPIDSADYAQEPPTPTALDSGLPEQFWGPKNYVLSSAAANVSLTGHTGLRAHVGEGAPPDENFMYWESFDSSTIPPRLDVTYTMPPGSPVLLEADATPEPVLEGEELTFTLDWADPGDAARAVICKTNRISASGTCPGGAWAVGAEVSAGPATASFEPTSADVGVQRYFAFACDGTDACSPAIPGTFTVESASYHLPRLAQITASNSQGSLTPTLEVSWRSPTGAGNLLLLAVSIAWESAVGQIVAPPGYTLVRRVDHPTPAGSSKLSTALFAWEGAPSQAGPVAVAADQRGVIWATLAEHSGIAVSGAADVGATASGTGTTAASGLTADTAQPVELWFGLLQSGASRDTPSGGFSELSPRWEDQGAYAKVAPVVGQASVSADLGSSSDWAGLIQTFRALPRTTVTALGAAPTPFSPNGDGVRETTTITGTIASGAPVVTWSLSIEDSAGTVLRTFNGQGGAVSEVWDGRDQVLRAVPDGTYTATLRAADNLGNSSSRQTSITLDTAAPGIGEYAASNRAFSPNADDVKDTTTLSANLSEAASPPVDWTLTIKDQAGDAVRSFTGTGTEVSEVWDGRDEDGAFTDDARYTAVLRAQDAAGNAASDSLTLTLDTEPPKVESWSPEPGANTLWRRPRISATLSDLAGVDPDSVEMQVDGDPLTASYDEESQQASATPAADLALDENHSVALEATDRAGNELQAANGFRVIKATQEPLQASIGATTATVPDPSSCTTSCQVTFDDVEVSLGAHTLTISSSRHEGRGTFERPVPLAGAVVAWETAAGAELVTPAGLDPVTAADEPWLDDAYDLAYPFRYEADTLPIGDITVSVPPGVAPGSTATLRMPAVTVAPGCADSSLAPDPGGCGGPESAGTDPLPDPEPEIPSDEELDPAHGVSYEQLTALEDATAEPAEPLPDLDPALLEAGARPPSGDTSPESFLPGSFRIKVKPGVDVAALVADHGGVAADIGQSITGPFDALDVEDGLDRWFDISVSAGVEKAKLVDYAADPRVEYAQLVDGAYSSTFVPDEKDSLYASQWNIHEPGGIHMESAWSMALYGEVGSRPIDGKFAGKRRQIAVVDSGIDDDHEDLAGKVDEGHDFVTGSTIEVGQSKDSGCDDYHGTKVAGINAETNNNKGIAGVNFHGHLIPIRVRGKIDGQCKWVGAGGDWIRMAVRKNADIINLSYTHENEDALECDAIANAYNRGVLTVTSYRQEPEPDRAYPGRCKHVLTTGGIEKDGSEFEFGRIDDAVDVVAPARGLATVAGGTQGGYKDPCCGGAVAGTSYAAPHAGGVLQLLISMGVPPREAWKTVRYSSTELSWCTDGCGKVHAYRALKSALENGVFEEWDSSTDPRRWSVRRRTDDSCTGSNPVAQSGTDYGGDGSYSLKTRCKGSGYVDVYQVVSVTGTWPYRFEGRVRRDSSGDPASSKIAVQVCFYPPSGDPTDPKCYPLEGSDVAIGMSWTYLSFVKTAPSWATRARIILRTRADTGDGAAYWDDVAFYAYRAFD